MAKSYVSKFLFVGKVAGRAGAEGQNNNILTQYLSYLTLDQAKISIINTHITNYNLSHARPLWAAFLCKKASSNKGTYHSSNESVLCSRRNNYLSLLLRTTLRSHNTYLFLLLRLYAALTPSGIQSTKIERNLLSALSPSHHGWI